MAKEHPFCLTKNNGARLLGGAGGHAKLPLDSRRIRQRLRPRLAQRYGKILRRESANHKVARTSDTRLYRVA